MEQPKKRHAALIPLSKRHHQILVMAQVLRSDVPDYDKMPNSLREKISYLEKEWKVNVQAIIEFEQKHIFSLLEDANSGGQSMQEGLINLQNGLLTAKKRIETEEVQTAHLDLIAHQLIAWVRFKERQLFQWMQLNLSDEALHQLRNTFDNQEPPIQ